MQRHHHHNDQRFAGPEGRRDIHRSDYGDDRSGYRSNDNAQFGGGYQAGGSSGEGAAYGGRDWYAGGAGDNRPYAQTYERGERGYQRDFNDRGYRDDRSNDAYRTDAYRTDRNSGRDFRREFGSGPGYCTNCGHPYAGERRQMHPRDDDGRFAGRDRYEYDRGWPPRGRR